MTPKFTTRDVDKSLYANYLKRAEECLDTARDSFEAQKWNAAAINAIHSCIAACDALCVYFLGKRHAGDSHNDAIRLLKTIGENDDEINTNANRASRILSIKSMAEYEERLVCRSEAEKAVKDCERFFEFAKKRFPSQE